MFDKLDNELRFQQQALSLMSRRQDILAGKHIPGVVPKANDQQLLYRIPDQPSADGNTVDMDRERVNFADNNVKYQSSLTILGAQIKGLMSVINQG